MWRSGVIGVAAALALGVGVALAADVTVPLEPVHNSGVTGTVELTQLPSNGGTHIKVAAQGLTPGARYVSLTYDNETCRIERYSLQDVIGAPRGGVYRADSSGNGSVEADVADNLAEIQTVSVRSASTGRLLACADVHP